MLAGGHFGQECEGFSRKWDRSVMGSAGSGAGVGGGQQEGG